MFLPVASPQDPRSLERPVVILPGISHFDWHLFVAYAMTALWHTAIWHCTYIHLYTVPKKVILNMDIEDPQSLIGSFRAMKRDTFQYPIVSLPKS